MRRTTQKKPINYGTLADPCIPIVSSVKRDDPELGKLKSLSLVTIAQHERGTKRHEEIIDNAHTKDIYQCGPSYTDEEIKELIASGVFDDTPIISVEKLSKYLEMSKNSESMETKINYDEVINPDEKTLLVKGNLCWLRVVLGVIHLLGKDKKILVAPLIDGIATKDFGQELGEQMSWDGLDLILSRINVRIKTDTEIPRYGTDKTEFSDPFVLGADHGEFIDGYWVHFSHNGDGNETYGHYVLMKERD